MWWRSAIRAGYSALSMNKEVKSESLPFIFEKRYKLHEIRSKNVTNYTFL